MLTVCLAFEIHVKVCSINRMEVLKRVLPFSGQEGLNELKKIAIRFEEKTYAAATSKVQMTYGSPFSCLQPEF